MSAPEGMSSFGSQSRRSSPKPRTSDQEQFHHRNIRTEEAVMGKSAATIVLVHGAWADGSSWNKVIPLLTHDRVVSAELHVFETMRFRLGGFRLNMYAMKKISA
jgi:hypothetical protein